MLFSILMAEPSRCYPVASYSTNSNPVIKLVRKFLPALISILHSKTEQGWGGGAGLWGSMSPEGLDFLCSTDAQTLFCMS